MNFIDKFILLTFPLMEVGFTVFGIPLRIGELTFFLSFLRILYSHNILKIKKVNKIGLSIITLIFINLILTISVNFFSDIDTNFYLKYITRNFLYIFVLLSFLIKPLNYIEINFNFFIKYILYLVSIFYFIEFFDYYIFSLNWEDLVFVAKQGKFQVKNFFIRFSGQSSEPAYIIPLLSIPLMYGLFKKKYTYAIVSLVYMVVTFSTFGYSVILFSIVYFFKNVDDHKLKKKVESFVIKGAFIVSIISLIFINKISSIVVHNFEKFQAYFNLGDAKNWSASQRIGHVELAFNLFVDSNFFRMLLGSGTGYYSKMSKEFTKFFLDDAEEAHNLYLSTLLDRGVVGLLILLFIFYFINKIKIPQNASGDLKFFFVAIKFGVYVRMLHWILTGMLWQYYFWVEVIILMAAHSYYLKVSDEKR